MVRAERFDPVGSEALEHVAVALIGTDLRRGILP